MKRKLTALLLAVIMCLAVLVPATAELLKYRDTGPRVGLLELKLANLNYYTGEIDNKFGYLLYQAVRAYQKNNGLKVDGVAGPETLNALGMGPAMGVPAPAPLKLTYGSSGAQVTQVQDRLRELGYFAYASDGNYFDSTYYAVIAFQRNNYLTADGIVGDGTWARLFSVNAIGKVSSVPTSVLRLKYGDSGPEVTKLQQRLAALGYYTSTVDGKFGYYTVLCVRAFQAKNLIKVDSVVGTITWDALMGAAAIPADKATPADPAIKVFRLIKDDKGPDILVMQKRLTELKYYAGSLDSVFNYTLYLSVRKFQRLNGLKVDGVVGEKTWAKMMSPDAVAYGK
ncbi:MAG: peptidoglycan-binding protein [Clostridiales bacterium]|nr:peptidoglycan-binding protein [Clostridiales bacterium]